MVWAQQTLFWFTNASIILAAWLAGGRYRVIPLLVGLVVVAFYAGLYLYFGWLVWKILAYITSLILAAVIFMSERGVW